jgi:hypothetical protein
VALRSANIQLLRIVCFLRMSRIEKPRPHGEGAEARQQSQGESNCVTQVTPT